MKKSIDNKFIVGKITELTRTNYARLSCLIELEKLVKHALKVKPEERKKQLRSLLRKIQQFKNED